MTTPDRAPGRTLAFTLCLLTSAVLTACGGGNGSSEPTATAQADHSMAAESLGDVANTEISDAEVDVEVPDSANADNFAEANNPDPRARAMSITAGFEEGVSPPVTSTPVNGPLFIDTSLIPVGSAGSPKDLVQPTTEVAPPSGGDFRTVCKYSHMAFDDPIVFPNQPGKSHLHAFFGNTGTNAFSTAQTLPTTGNSTCRGGTVNRTAYWVPALIDTRTGTPVKPKDSHFYYKSGGINPSSIQPMPAGLRMIAGDPKNTSPSGPYWYSCRGGPNTMTIPNCGAGVDMFQFINFPQCWDGKNLDSPDHKSHMAYKVGKSCPATHPVALPQVSFSIIYVAPDATAPLHWRLSSDTYDRNMPAGYSTHGDWFNGWKPEISNTWAKKCIAESKDCHSHLLGDGRKITF